MARIELRDATVRIKDGFGGTAAVDDLSIMGGDTTLFIDTIANLSNGVTVVPVGARFNITGVGSPTLTKFVVTAVNNNEIQRVTVDATSGNFTLTFSGQTTGNIAFDANAATVLAALNALSNIAPGDVIVTLVSASVWDVEFAATYANTNVPIMTATDVDLAGGGDSVTVTTRYPGETTHLLTFTPALDGSDLPANNDPITFLPQEIEIKVGDGDIQYTEKNEYLYDLDRGDLDTVREGNQQPLEVTMDFVYEHITTGTNETISPMDALKRRGSASGWYSSATDQCEPYAVDIEVEHVAPCGTSQDEITLFPDFRSDQREVSFKDAVISVTGRCNAIEPIVTRV